MGEASLFPTDNHFAKTLVEFGHAVCTEKKRKKLTLAELSADEN